MRSLRAPAPVVAARARSTADSTRSIAARTRSIAGRTRSIAARGRMVGACARIVGAYASVVAAASVTLATVVSIAACGGPGQASDDGRPSVVAAFYPYYFLARQIGGPQVAATNLTQPGVEPHDLELSPRQVGEIGAADLVVYQQGFQPAVDEAVAQNRPPHVLDVGSVVPPTGNGTPDHAPKDPHVWLDPDRFATIATAIGEALAGADPGHAGDYRTRATSLVARLEALDREFRRGLENCRSRAIVTSHAAFGYLAKRYRLEQIPITGLAPGAEPSPAHVKAVAEAIREHHVSTIFFETLANPKAADTLARDAGARTAVLDPVEGLTDPARADYFSVMQANLDTLRHALGCT